MNDSEDPWGAEPVWARQDYSEDEEDSNGDRPLWFGAQHVVALVDCSRPDMFVPCIEHIDGNLITPLDAVLVACERLCRDRVLRVATQKTGKRDGVGVLLYGTQRHQHDEEDGEEDDDDDHHATAQQSSAQTLVELYPPGVIQIRTLRSCLDDPICGRKRKLENEFVVQQGQRESESGGSDSRPLRMALQEANKAFADAKFVKTPRVTSHQNPADKRSIWIFTNDDRPAMLADEQRQLAQMMQDIAEGGIEFVLWALPKSTGEPFDSSLVYDNLCHDIYASPQFSMGEMLENIGFQGKKPRRVCNMPMLLPDWRNHKEEAGISVDFYKLVQEQKKPQPKWINQTTKQQTERVTQTIIKETGEVVKTTGDDAQSGSDRILHFANFGMDRVPISPEDVAKIKKVSNAGTETNSLILLGFKPQDAIPVTHIVDTTYFIYPNDEGAEGSTDAFANLHAAMLRKKVVAIGELLTRVTASSRMVAIFPQAERLEEGEQVTPPGMIVVSLPYEDDVRKMQQETDENVVTEDLVEEAIDLIRHQKLTDVEIGVNFENAAIERFWSYIEAVALETTIPTKEQYETELNEDAVMKVAGAQIEAFRDSLPEDVAVEKKSKGVPRKRKAAEPIADETGIDWVQLYTTDSIESCKVDDLKSYLRSIGARLGGNKGELIFRVSKSISGELQNGVL